jgi:hypothetical protein
MKLERNWTALPVPGGIELEESVLVNRGGNWEAYSLAEGNWVRSEAPPPLIALGDNEFLFPG